nr:MAG TPA: hypothetical protein [Caudoviricetes sp.]
MLGALISRVVTKGVYCVQHRIMHQRTRVGST